MAKTQLRHSWDTTIKHLARHNVLDSVLTPDQISKIPSSNLSRWKNENDEKYLYADINELVKQEIELIKRLNQSSNIKRINECYFKLVDTFHFVISKAKGIKTLIKHQKELVVDAIESVKEAISIDKALKVFNISRTTYQHYKTIVIHKCETSYFKWCTKRFSNQLLPQEVLTIKSYMAHEEYRYWSKASIYLRAIRDDNLRCCISTFYKYCRLLGFAGNLRTKRPNNNKPLRTFSPNEAWCADVTIFKTTDGMKHYIHVLMDHYSRKILGYSIENNNSGKAIRNLLKDAYLKHRPKQTLFLTDGGCENTNANVFSLLGSLGNSIVHKIAQRDVVLSNSMIEAFNKTLKYEFLYPMNINTKSGLVKVMAKAITKYNNSRPQWVLGGNTPSETFSGISMNFDNYRMSFIEQKQLRITQNKKE